MPGRWIEFDRLRLMKKYMYKNIYIYTYHICMDDWLFILSRNCFFFAVGPA